MFRIVALPFVIIIHQAHGQHPSLELVVLIALMVLSDFFDGYASRKLNQVSEIGKWLDPIADKACAVVLFSYVWWIGMVPAWFFLLVIVRDVVIMAGSLYIRKKRGKVAMSVWTGKVAVFILSLYWITLVFLPSQVTWIIVFKYASTFMLLYSGAIYGIRGYRILKGADYQ